MSLRWGTTQQVQQTSSHLDAIHSSLIDLEAQKMLPLQTLPIKQNKNRKTLSSNRCGKMGKSSNGSKPTFSNTDLMMGRFGLTHQHLQPNLFKFLQIDNV